MANTIVLAVPTPTPGVVAPPLTYPAKEPGTLRSYALDLAADCGTDPIVGLTAAAAPSGIGELSLVTLAPLGTQAVLTVMGGAPGRDYVLSLTGVLNSGQDLAYTLFLPVNADGALVLTPDPPSTSYGNPLTWTATPALDFSVITNSQNLLLGW